MKKITKEWLGKISACRKGIVWFEKQPETDAVKVLEKLIVENQLDWANWTICRIFNHKQKIQYAVFAAKQVITFYEKRYPTDKRPRLAIEAAKKCIKNPSPKNKKAAHAADDAAYADDAAAYAAHAADDAAYAAAYAADAADAADAAVAMKIKILEFGINLLKEQP